MNIRTILITLGILLVFPAFVLAQLTPKEELGKKIFFDKISSPDRMSCADCHAPEVGFTGPIPGINFTKAIYPGAIPQRFGNRKPPSAAYATLSPVFHYDGELFIGGNFWDGRATGEDLGDPAAEQALGPFLNPVEQNNASKEEVLMQIANSQYAYLWEEAWGEPISYETPDDIELNYDRVGLSIAAYEASREVNQFTSKYDYFLDPDVDVSLTTQEAWGLELFNDPAKGNCAACHPSEGEGDVPPLFTDFSFDNLGTPKNPDNPFYRMDEVFLNDGSPINPQGASWIDPGLGGFLLNHPNNDWKDMAADNMGKHKVPTLRNVDKRPGNGFTKAYMHNGVFKSLKEVVHFYNTRDVEAENWPAPEVADNVNDAELGDLGLTDDEEDAIVAFMKTLSDGYKLPRIKKEGIDLIVSEKYATLRVEGPNPFNPSTRLGYYIPENANIQLQVFNITGEKVATLQSGFMSAGEHQVEFNGNNLATGIYLVSLYTGKELITVKLMLMK